MHPTSRAGNSGLLYSFPPKSSFYPPRIFVRPISISMRKPGARLQSVLLFSQSIPAFLHLPFASPCLIILKVYQRYFSCAPAHSPDGLQRSLNPFAHSRETVAGFALTVKSAYRHRTQKSHPFVSLQSCTFL